ncbi:MAG: nucleotidyltransferase domain-containing protein [Candidatus Binatia bacterium]
MQPVAAQRVEQALKKKIDWEHVVENAFHHGTAQLLFSNLHRLNIDGVPKTVLSQLEHSYKAVARWNLSLTGELLKLLNLFRERGIRALPLKGPALAAAAYGNLSLRMFGDLDILMSREDILKGKDLVLREGYQPKLHLTPGQETEYLRSHHDYKFVRSADGIVVELQWGITQWSFAFPLDFDEIWEHREIGSLAGAPVFNLPPETLLLILCVHGTKHRWEKLMWICDIAEFVDAGRDKIDWPRLLGRARVLGGERMLLLGLCLAQDLLGTVLPGKVAARINLDSRIKSLAAQVDEGLFRGGSSRDRLHDEHPIFYWKTRERMRDKWGLLWKYFPEYFFRLIIPNKSDRAVVQLPPFLSVGYYLIRPVRLALRRWSIFRDGPNAKGN